MEPVLLLSLGLAGLFAGTVLMFVVLGVGGGERQAVGKSLAAIEAMTAAPQELRARELERPFVERVVTPAVGRLAAIGRRFTPADQAERLQHKLDLAGNPREWDVDRVLAAKVLGAGTGALIGILVSWFLELTLGLSVVVVVVSVALGYYLPNISIYHLAAKRSDRIRKDLPDGLDLLTISVEAGLAFDAAVAQVARHTQGPLADEFFRVLSEMQIGSSRMDALRGLGERTDVDDIKTFVTAMVQADSFGIPVADVLRTQAREMRVRRRQRAEERAQQVPVKIVFPLIACILPALFVVVIGPAVITVVRELLPAL